MDISLNKIKLIVKKQIGLDSSTIGDTTIENIIHQRMHHCNIKNIDDYLSLIISNQNELDELLEITVIPETWFFRDIRPFEIIQKKIQQALMSSRSSHFRILSLPSSTGEEPYSLAIYLIHNGITPSAFKIDAVDISKRALQIAKQGIYGSNSFRGKNYATYQKPYFQENGTSYKINTNIQENINFYHLNILHTNHNLDKSFDFILCRNLLIYFDTQTKGIAFNNLSSFLKDTGYLFIGHSEFGSVPKETFQNIGFEHAFALIKHTHPEFKVPCENKPHINKKNNLPAKYHKTENTANFKSLIKPSPQTDTAVDNNSLSLEKVRELSSAEEFKKAETLCIEYIDHNGENAEALFLLGLIHECQKKPEDAETFYRKSLYLDPRHYNSLVHLALLLQENGDIKNSILLKKRADRVFQSSEKKVKS